MMEKRHFGKSSGSRQANFEATPFSLGCCYDSVAIYGLQYFHSVWKYPNKCHYQRVNITSWILLHQDGLIASKHVCGKTSKSRREVQNCLADSKVQ